MRMSETRDNSHPRGDAASPLRRILKAPATTVTGVMLIFYVVFTMIALGLHEWNPQWFVWVGERYADLDPAGRIGYDGQFAYYIARDGFAAMPRLDNPAYRLQRILFPAIVSLLAWPNPDLIPWAMIAVNIAAIVLTTYLLARWLREQGLSCWHALIYSLYIGTFMAFSRSLNEPLAFCLAACGVALWLCARYRYAVVALALALFAKEITILFVFALAIASLVQRRPRQAFCAVSSLAPWLTWQGYLYLRLGAIAITAGPPLEHIPLFGILPHLALEPGRLSSLLFVALPACIALPISVLELFKHRGRSAVAWCLLLHSLLVSLMPLDVYDHIMHAGRNASGLVLSLLFLLPTLKRPLRALFAICWILPTLAWIIPILRWAPWLSQI